MMISMLTGSAFSILYVTLYPVLRGKFVIHVYPPWSTAQAVAYVTAGVLLQAWFCFDRPGKGRYAILWQVVTGFAYVAAALSLSGGLYQT